MRWLPASRASTAVAVVAAVVAILAVMFPSLGFGAPTTSHGGSPSDVFMTTEPEICQEVDSFGSNPARATETEVSFDVDSNLLVYFTFEGSGFDNHSELLLSFSIMNGNGFFEETPFEWGFDSSGLTHDSSTVMWTFDGVAAGDYTVGVGARTDPLPGPRGGGNPHATLENCAMTVFVLAE